MLLRISLIVAILAGAGVIVISQLKVKPHIQSIIDTRDDFEKKYKSETARANGLNKNLKETQGKLADTEKKLAETETTLAATKTQVENEQKRANGIQKDLDATRQNLKEAQQTVAAWNALGIPVDQVKSVIDSEKKLTANNEALTAENRILNRKYKQTQAELDVWVKGREVDPLLPVGLKGKVLVVDPKWDFVVLDIGEKQGVLQNGVMMVSRNSKLVGKVRIMSVQSDRSIANILPNWKLSEVMEGDQVLY